MGSTHETASTAPGAGSPGKWRYSLGTLLRAVTVAGLAMLALVQFGPLAAARDIGLALAISLALVAYGMRRPRLWLAAGLLAAVGFVPTILAAGAPFSHRSAICLGCGMSRDTHEVCGWTTKDEISDTEISRWAAPMVPTGHTHSWAGCSLHQRSHWFGIAPIACGGPREGASMAWQLAHLGDHAAAERALREYQDIIAGTSTKSIAVHRREVDDAVNAAASAMR